MRTASFVRRALLHAALLCGFAAEGSIAASMDSVDQLVALVARTDRIQPADTTLARRLLLETMEAAGDPSPAAARAALLAGRVFERIGAYVPAHELYGEAAMSSAELDRPDRAV